LDSGYDGYNSSLMLSPPSIPVLVPEVTAGDQDTIDFKNLPNLKDLSPNQAR
jgi:hypothetical protein